MEINTQEVERPEEVIQKTHVQTIPVNGSDHVEKQKLVTGIRKAYIRFRIRLRIFLLAYKGYGSLGKTVKVVKELEQLKMKVFGGNAKRKLVQCDNKFYSHIYIPGFPSKAFDGFVESKLAQFFPMKKKTNPLSFIFFAITSKCPLRCEHCFEWDNLNKKETFSLDELKQVVSRYQEEGIAQFHFSGGEPMVRINDLEHLISSANKKSTFWVLTSGFNVTKENAKRLKIARATGIVVSLDHYDAPMHNAFRGFSILLSGLCRQNRKLKK